jgi:membrane-associated protease RseP (regulator of RpoE activity)
MVPLDGGFLFNDYMKAAIKKVKKDISTERLDKIVGNISLILSLTLLFIIVFPFFFKYI